MSASCPGTRFIRLARFSLHADSRKIGEPGECVRAAKKGSTNSWFGCANSNTRPRSMSHATVSHHAWIFFVTIDCLSRSDGLTLVQPVGQMSRGLVGGCRRRLAVIAIVFVSVFVATQFATHGRDAACRRWLFRFPQFHFREGKFFSFSFLVFHELFAFCVCVCLEIFHFFKTFPLGDEQSSCGRNPALIDLLCHFFHFYDFSPTLHKKFPLQKWKFLNFSSHQEERKFFTTARVDPQLTRSDHLQLRRAVRSRSFSPTT